MKNKKPFPDPSLDRAGRKNNDKGQSLVDLIFAVGVVVVVMTGIIILLVNTINSKNKGFDRKKATELTDVVMENLINQKRNDPENFWKFSKSNNNYDGNDISFNYSGYKYSIGFTNISDDLNYPNCGGIGITDCANAVVTIDWGNSQVSNSQRFFSRSGN